MEKSQYGPPQDVLAPPYPGFPAGNQGSGGGTAYHPQPGFQGGPQPSMYPPPPQPSMYPTPLQYGTDMAQPTNAPGITQVVVIQQPLLRDVPGQMTCPYCQVLVLTEATHTPGLAAWLVFGVLCCFLCWPCSWIPFCVDSCKDVEHRCPNCRRVIYIHKRE